MKYEINISKLGKVGKQLFDKWKEVGVIVPVKEQSLEHMALEEMGTTPPINKKRKSFVDKQKQKEIVQVLSNENKEMNCLTIAKTLGMSYHMTNKLLSSCTGIKKRKKGKRTLYRHNELKIKNRGEVSDYLSKNLKGIHERARGIIAANPNLSYEQARIRAWQERKGSKLIQSTVPLPTETWIMFTDAIKVLEKGKYFDKNQAESIGIGPVKWERLIGYIMIHASEIEKNVNLKGKLVLENGALTVK